MCSDFYCKKASWQVGENGVGWGQWEPEAGQEAVAGVTVDFIDACDASGADVSDAIPSVQPPARVLYDFAHCFVFVCFDS